MKRLALNSGVMKKARVLCLLSLVLFAGANNEAWGNNTRYYTSALGGNWSEPETWANGSVPNLDAGDFVTIAENTEVIIDVVTTISEVILSPGSLLRVNQNLTLTGNNGGTIQQRPLKGKGGNIFINSGVKVIVEKQVYAYSNLIIDGDGELEVYNHFDSEDGTTITTNCDILLRISPPKNGDGNVNANIIVNSGTFTNERNKTLKSLKIEGGTYYAKGTTTVSGNLTLSGGSLQIESNKTLTATANPVNVSGDATISGPASGTAATLAANVINLATGKTLTIDGIVNLSSSVTFTGSGKLKIANGGTLTIGGTPTLPENITIENGGTLNLTSNVTLTNNITIEEGGVLSLSGENIYFANEDLSKSANITGKGTLRFSRNGDATVHRLTNCTDGVRATYQYNKKITYNSTCTHIIPGTYYSLALNADTEGETRMLCDAVIVNNAFNPGRDFTLQGNGGRKAFVVKGSVSGGKKLTFNNLNVAFGNESAGTMSVSVTEFNFGENDTLTIAGNVTFKTNTPLFNGVDGKNGEIIINDGKLLTSEQTITFTNDQIISGNGKFKTYKKITGTKLITTVDVDMTGGDANGVEYVVAGGTFTNTNTNKIANLTVDGGIFVSSGVTKITNLSVKSGTFVAAENTTADAMTVTGGTVQVEKDKTLTVTTGNKLNVDGTATFVGKAGSKFITDNVELFEGAALTIKDTVTLTRPLVVNNNATLVGGTVNDTLKWDSPEHCKINVTAGTLTISNTLTVAGNVTLEGAMKVAEGGNLNLAGSTITFGPTAKFTGTQGNISFVEGVVISGLKNDPDVKAKYLKFPGAVTYDATCAAMFPGVYGNGLTLNTEAGKNIAIYDSVTITGALNWAAGRIVLNGNPLIVKETFNSGSFDENHMVVAGKNSKYIFVADAASTGLDLTIPVGTSSLTSAGSLLYSYSPATINISDAVAIGDTISVEVEGEALLGKATDLRRYWTISSNQNFTGDVTFKFTAADDLLGYGSKDYWAVFHGSSVYEKGGAQIKSPFDKYFSITDENINGVWTACEYPAAVTLYSFGSGYWDNPSSWTTNSAGSTQPAEGAQAPNERCDVVILPGSVITGRSAGVRARSVTLKNETSTLVINPDCADVSIVNLTGEGRLVIKNKGSFPEGIDNTDLFMAPGGGTTEFSGSSSGEYELSKTEFNNLIINLEDGAEVKLPSANNHKLQINGYFELENGEIIYTAENQSIHVGGNMNVGSGGKITNESGKGNLATADTLQVGGDLINDGIIRLTKRLWDDYSIATAMDDEKTDGRGILRFVGENNADFKCNSTTNISQLIIDKGSNDKYKVTLFSKTQRCFGLLGRSTNNTNPEGFIKDVAYPANPVVLYKPLWLRAGTLELTGHVFIRSLSELGGETNGLDCFYIPERGSLILNGRDVKVWTTFSETTVSYASVIPAGRLIIKDGEFDGRGSSGITLVGSSYIEVQGGTLRGAQFRPSAFAKKGLTTYVQSGGTVTFDGCGELNTGAPVFYMPEASYTFKMTGGTLIVSSASPKGTFVVKSNPENGKISGGEIIINTGAAMKSGKDESKPDYLIATELPLYKLTLRNSPEIAPKSYARHYIKNINETISKYYCDITASTIVENDLTIENGVVLDCQGLPVTVGGNLNIESGSTVYTKGGGTSENEFIMNGSGELTVAGTVVCSSSDANAGFYNLTFAEGADVAIKNDITVRGLFKLANRATMSDGSSNRTYTMLGDVEVDGTYEKCSSCGSKMVIKGENIYSSGTGELSYVDINAGSELKLADRTNAGRQTKLTISGNLNFVSETQFNIGGSNLEFGSEATVTGAFGPTRMIRTVGTSSRGVTKVFATNGEFKFPFGFVSSEGYSYYTPANIKYTTADTYGSVTSRPVFGQAFRDANSLKCYWITDERGFSGASLSQEYFWYDEDGKPSLSEGSTAAWVPARRNGSTWQQFGTNFVDLDGTANSSYERRIYFDPNVTTATGYYTCGLPTSFSNGAPLYTSNVVADTLDWFDVNTWSESPNGDPCGCIPSETTPVYIGDEANNRVVRISVPDDYAGPRAECASLDIAPGSTLDLTNYNNFKAPIVDVDESVGAGKLRLSSPYFPEGDFGKFNGEFGGMVEYYGKGYTIPTESIDGSALVNYCNLLISGGAIGNEIGMPASNVTVFDSLKISGSARTNPTGSFTIDIHKDFIIANGGRFEVFENGSANQQTIKVADSLIVAEGATMIATGTAANSTTNLLQIGRDLIVDGTFTAKSGNYKFNTEFVGKTDSRIRSSQDLTLNMLTCNKNSIDDKLILKTTKKINTANDKALLDLVKGTFVVEIGDGNSVELTGSKTLTIPGEACLSIVSGTAKVATGGDATGISLKGKIQISGGELIVGTGDAASKYNSIQYTADGKPTIEISGGTLNVIGQISRTQNQTTGSLIWKQYGGDVVVQGRNRGSVLWLTDFAAFEVLESGEFDMRGGTLTVLNGNGNEGYGDIFIESDIMNCTGGTIIVGGGSQKVYIPSSLNNIEVDNGATLNAYTALDVNELTINNTGVFNARNHDLTIRKAFRNYNNENMTGISAGFNYGTTAQLTKFVGSDMTYEGANASATQFNTVEIEGDLALVSNHSAISVGGNLTQSSGTVTDNGNVISLFGNLIYYGGFEGTGGINFCRTNDVQYIEGNSLESIGAIIVNNPNEVYLNTNVRISNKIRLGSNLYINRNSLILGKNATVESTSGTFDGTHMLRLNGEHDDKGVTKYVKKDASNFTLPIGVVHEGNRYYTPAVYDFTSNDKDNRSITVKPINSLHNNLTFDPSMWLAYYWMVTTEGFGEDGKDNFSIESKDFSVTQTYYYPAEKLSGTSDTLFPEYMYYGGTDEYKWIDLRGDGTTGSELANIGTNNVTFKPFGHIAGDYTVGVVGSNAEDNAGIYTGRPILYTRGDGGGDWDNPKTWNYIDGSGVEHWLYDDTGDVAADYKIDGNPVHILPGDVVNVKRSHTNAYSLTFDDGTEMGVLNLGNTVGSNFGRVNGTGKLIMEPVETEGDKYYKMPAGNFTTFLSDERSIVEFAGGDGKLPNAVVGHVSLPLQNVILSGGGTKTLTKEYGEYINKSMTIRNGTKLAFGNTPIYMKGDWIDENTGDGGFLPGSNNDRSIVTFNGTSRQKIVLSGNNESFYRVIINNPSDVEIVRAESATEAGIIINKSLEFTNGCLIDTAENTSVTLVRTATVTRPGATSFVAGPLTWKLNSGDNRDFPIGGLDESTGKVYALTKLNNVSVNGDYTVTFHSGTYSFDVVWPFTSMSNTEKWTVSGPTGATAQLGLRVGSRTFSTINSSMLKRVKIAGKKGAEWEIIESSHNTGSIPTAIILSAAALTISEYEEYTLGSSNSTARLLSKTEENQTDETYICDGDADATAIPVYFTGMGGPYTVTYKITDKEKNKSVTVTSPKFTDSEGVIALTGSDLAAKFGRTDGYSTQPYVVEITGMKDGSEDGMPAGNNKANVNVLYNPKPVIDGAGTVGMGDERVYTVTADDKVDAYTWSDNSDYVEIAPAGNTANIQFGTNTSTYSVTLTVRNTYKESHDKVCYRENSKNVAVDIYPQPEITGNFGICRADGTAEFMTEKVGSHTYQWVVKDEADENVISIITIDKTGESADNNKLNLTWDDSFTASKVTLHVTEKNGDLGKDVKRVITFYDDVTFNADDFYGSVICDNTVGTVTIEHTNINYSYIIYKGETAMCEEFGGSGTDAPIQIHTSEPLRYADGNLDFKVVIKNKGCQKQVNDKSIQIHENPSIKEFIIADNELYKGNLVQIDYTKTSTVGIKGYEFAYSLDGVTYSAPAPTGIRKDDLAGKKMVIEIPKADRMKGVLTIKSDDDIKSCDNTYAIDKPISNAYLWRGDDADTDWNNDANWWSGEAPESGDDVVVRDNYKITFEGGKSGTKIDMPTVNGTDAAVNNINVGTGAKVNLADGAKLTIHKDVTCDGQFNSTGSGEVAFTDAEHTVSGTGSFANLSNAGTVTASSDMSVTGNITNSGKFVGTVKLNGAAQEIGGGDFENLTVENLTVDNAGVTINNSISIDGKLTLTKGVVSVNGGQALVFTKNAKPVAGTSANSYVDGTIWKYGKTPFVFPTGSKGRLAQIGIAPGSDATDATYYSASYTLIADKEPLTTGLPAGMSRVSQAETWNVDCPAGKSSKLTLYWSDAKASGITPGKESDLLVAHYTDGNWKAESAKFDGVNSITTTAYITSYSPFTFGAKNPEPDINPLPVTFTAFTGRQDGNSVVLEWTTMSENNNDYFEIERSSDGINFVTIGYVEGAGNSNSRIDYSFSDNAPEQGRLYYRLSQVDFDGTREYADKVVTVTFANNKLAVSIVPNPTSGLFTLQNCGNCGQLVIMTQNGMVVKEFEVTDFNQQINIGDLANGIYIAKYTTDKESTILKIVKF